MRVCVLGLWHLGSVTSACLASLGHTVIGLDFEEATIASLGKGKSPLYEPGLDALLGKGLDEGRVSFTSNPAVAGKDIEVLWVSYDTPVDDDDNADVDYVVGKIAKVLPFLPRGATILISSQMPVGSVRRIEALAEKEFPAKKFDFAYSPENLRLGKALDVFLKPDRIVVGFRTEKQKERLKKLIGSITEKVEWMSVESAEMTKHAINAFLATSVVFANEVASVCEIVGADAKEVERGLKSEQRIGPKAYLSPGLSFAGGTLARDVNFLNQTAATQQLKIPLLASIKPSNDEHKGWIRRCLERFFPDLAGRRIAVWGLTYKPGTNTLRRSLAIELCRWLAGKGARIAAHDPEARDLPSDLKGNADLLPSPLDAVRNASALVVATEWPQYREVSPQDIIGVAPNVVIVDGNRFLSQIAKDERLTYCSVGKLGTPRKEGK